MILEREGKSPIRNPTTAQIEGALRKLRTVGPSAFASVTAPDGTYLQTAGSPAGLVLERREGSSDSHFRAFQSPPVVPFEDGTELVFTAGRIALRTGEWFQLRQVIEIFAAFVEHRALPAYVQWRDLTAQVSSPSFPSRIT